MRWTVEENEPPLQGTGTEILLDGEAQRHVTAFDTDQGWVEAICLSGDECWRGLERPDGTRFNPPSPGEIHRDPDNREEVCRAPRRYGLVEVIRAPR